MGQHDDDGWGGLNTRKKTAQGTEACAVWLIPKIGQYLMIWKTVEGRVQNGNETVEHLKSQGYTPVPLDLQGYRAGSR